MFQKIYTPAKTFAISRVKQIPNSMFLKISVPNPFFQVHAVEYLFFHVYIIVYSVGISKKMQNTTQKNRTKLQIKKAFSKEKEFLGKKTAKEC